jgi:hypothetical protein
VICKEGGDVNIGVDAGASALCQICTSASLNRRHLQFKLSMTHPLRSAPFCVQTPNQLSDTTTCFGSHTTFSGCMQLYRGKDVQYIHITYTVYKLLSMCV